VLAITSPANGATFLAGSTVSLSGTATDTQDGNISSRIQWSDNGVAIGSGSLLSTILTLAGTHTIGAKVTDNNGATVSSQVSITITALQQSSTSTSTSTATLTLSKAVASDGTQKVYLRWSGLPGSTVDIYRNSTKIGSTENDGYKGDVLPTKTPGTYSYRLCSTGTTTCTNTASITF
jgi:chitinase